MSPLQPQVDTQAFPAVAGNQRLVHAFPSILVRGYFKRESGIEYINLDNLTHNTDVEQVKHLSENTKTSDKRPLQ